MIFPARKSVHGIIAILSLAFLFGSFLSAVAQQNDWAELNGRVDSLYQAGKYPEALSAAQQLLDFAQEKFGPDSPNVASCLNKLAVLCCPYRRIRQFRIRYTGTGFILLFCALAAFSQAVQSESKTKLWQTYVDAAVEANAGNDFAGAQVLLKSAGQLAEEIDPKGPRPVLSRLLQELNYVDLGQMDAAKKLGQDTPRLDFSSLDPSLLPFAGTLIRLTNIYYDRWKNWQKNQNDKNDEEHKDLQLEEAGRCLLIELALDQKLQPNSPELAGTLSYQGLIFMKQHNLEDAIKKFTQALEIWGRLEKSAAKLAQGGRTFSLFASGSSGGDQLPSTDPLSMRVLLGRTYKQRGDELRKKRQENAAREDYRRAEEQLGIAARALLRQWPNHRNAATVSWDLAYAYVTDGRYKEAETWYYRALSIYERAEGPKGDDIPQLVKDIADLLRKTHRPDKARVLEARYHVSE